MTRCQEKRYVLYCMRKSRVAEKYVRTLQYICDDSTTAVWVTQWFEVKVRLHQRSALSPCLFAGVMNTVKDEIRQEAMLFVDDIVICSESKEQVEEKLEGWRYALERRGMKVDRGKAEYMTCEREAG